MAVPVFKTGVGEDLVQVGSIPIRLRHEQPSRGYRPTVPAAVRTRSVTFSMSASADGFVVGPDGGFGWGAPDPEVFRFHLDELAGTGVHLLGRRLYETMRYWEDESAGDTDDERAWGVRWRALPKVVFSRTLTTVEGSSTRLASGGLAEEVARLRDEPGDGDIAVGGAELAAQAAALGLVDEYRVFVHPVVLGGGRPYFPRDERQRALDLVDSRTFTGSGVVHLRYRVRG